ncbi:MAG: hypothetical protein LBB85_03520 [Dysgonamonadaceae bacterium]|jgi:hypothetical protein|nr:hypothetical protein [Dysgonamonadaceae bacterium]
MEAQKKEKSTKVRKWGIIAIGIIVLILAMFIYVRFYFVWGEGVKAGQLNYVVYKGYIFKTYEGKLIQAGLRSGNVNGSIQSNEFIFSVSNEEVAKKLMLAGGQDVDLHYKEYFASVPWRGHSKFVVDSIIKIKTEK